VSLFAGYPTSPFLVYFALSSSGAFWASHLRDASHNLLCTKGLRKYKYNIILCVLSKRGGERAKSFCGGGPRALAGSG